MAYTQGNRQLGVITPLGEDVLLLTAFHGSEGVSQLFYFNVEMVSENEAISFADLIGKNVTLRVRLADGSDRYFNGFVSRFTQGGRDHDFTYYRAQIVPWLWFLTRTSNCRIFQDKTVPDIIKSIFQENGFADYELKVYRKLTPREYCVQYRESDFNFISRLLEEEGIFYFFKHDNGKHVLVLADLPVEHLDCPQQATARYELTAGGWQDDDVITEFQLEQELRAGKYTQNDYNFQTPATPLTAGVGENPFEIYDFHPGEYTTRSGGELLARVRLEAEMTPGLIGYGVSGCRAFTSGYKFQLKDHYRNDLNQAYVLTSIRHEARQGGDYRSGTEDGYRYSNTFDCIPSSVPFRPRGITPHPVVQGAQTAVVVGPAGEEIYTDHYGRVKVQFHWDRQGKKDEHSSCWIRVAQLWAGKKWGAMFIPRIGHEVVVEFLEGDPDQPLITGQVYNGVQTPPYSLPDEHTKSTIKSNSSKGSNGFNELRFEDKKGEEQIFIHAEKNLDIRVKEKEFKTVEKDLHLVVNEDQYTHIQNKRHETIDSDTMIKMGGDHNLDVGGKQAVRVAGSHSFHVSGAVAEVFDQSHSEQVSMAYYLKGMSVVIEGSTGVTLKCGGNSVVVDPTGVTVTGAMVTLDGKFTRINSGPGSPALSGMAGSLVAPMAASAAADADQADPGEMAALKATQIEQQKGKYGALKFKPYKPSAGDSGAEADPAGAQKKKDFIEIQLEDEHGKPVPGEPYRIVLPDGETAAEGTLDEKGFAAVRGIDPGACKVTFPNMEKKAWKPK